MTDLNFRVWRQQLIEEPEDCFDMVEGVLGYFETEQAARETAEAVSNYWSDYTWVEQRTSLINDTWEQVGEIYEP